MVGGVVGVVCMLLLLLPLLMPPALHALQPTRTQVSLGGLVHALTPLAAANPAIHAFDGEEGPPAAAAAAQARWPAHPGVAPCPMHA